MDNLLVGVVLCGGYSTRMGSDKGLLRHHGKSWAYRAYEKLEQITPDVYLSINPNQINSYRQIFPLNRLIVDSVACKGPLAGLLSVHKSKPDFDVLLLACDMVRMDVKTLKILVEEYERDETKHDFYVFNNGCEFEPLVGIYRSSGVKKVFAQYEEQKLTKHSIKHILENGNTYAIKSANPAAFTNVNSPADLVGRIATAL